jgi:hypothetical protein
MLLDSRLRLNELGIATGRIGDLSVIVHSSNPSVDALISALSSVDGIVVDLLPRSAEASLYLVPGLENGMRISKSIENPATLLVSDNSRTPKQYFALETIVRIAESTKGFIHRAASPMADPGAVVEEFGLFKVHTGAAGLSGTMIQVGREYYPLCMPARTRGGWPRLPGQTIGVCYIHAAINAVLNESVFVEAFVKHLAKLIEASPYSRKKGEDVEAANVRRFGKRTAHRITNSEQFEADTEETMEMIYEDIAINKDLFMWCRNVILYHTLTAALRSKDQGPQGRAFDARVPIFRSDLSCQKVKGRFAAILKKVESSYPTLAMREMFSLSGLLIRDKYNKLWDRGSMLVTVPGTGETLCIGTRPWRKSSAFPVNASCLTGILEMGGRIGGHASAYVRDTPRDVPTILESHGYNQSLADNVEYHKILYPVNKWFHSWRWDPIYTCVIDQTPPVDKSRFRRLSGGGSKQDAKLGQYQAALLAPSPENLRHLMICGTSVCALDEDLKAALFAVEAFVHNEVDEADLDGSVDEGVWNAAGNADHTPGSHKADDSSVDESVWNDAGKADDSSVDEGVWSGGALHYIIHCTVCWSRFGVCHNVDGSLGESRTGLTALAPSH